MQTGVDHVQLQAKERLPQLDIFRAFAIFSVIQVHATSYAAGWQALGAPGFYFYNWMNIFFRIGTSSFIFLSSFVLFYNYYEKPVNRSLIGRFYKKRLTYIILPYILVSFCYFLVVVWIQKDFLNQSFAQLLQSLGVKLLTGTAYTHLYFIFISIQFYILFPLLLGLVQWMRNKKWAAFWIFPAGLAVQWVFFFWNKYYLELPNKGSYAPSYMSFYMLGAVVAIYFEPIKAWLTTDWKRATSRQKAGTVLLWGSWLILSFIDVQLYYALRTQAYVAGTTTFEFVWNVHLLLSALVLMKAAFLVHRKGSKFWVKALTRLGELSFAIYLFHPVVLLVYRMFRNRLAGDQIAVAYFFFILAGSACTLLLSWVFVHLCFKKLPFAALFLGSVPGALKKRRESPIQDSATSASVNVNM
ncbi:acyltransferase [Paenibacillus sp. A14]|uniref:acyltransferase n=1 Tax=Paenibacillus sp. A14 TaxID=3119820 RepID=UPI002FE3B257